MLPRTNHLLFLDECGTHDLTHVDPQFPVFVLAGVLVGERYYTRSVVPRIQSLKRRHRLEPTTVLHSRDIRRCQGPFTYLQDNDDAKQALYADINGLFDGLRFRLVASVIDKRRLLRRFICPVNPYEISISQLLSLTCGAPGIPGPNRPRISQIIAESRGKAPDRLLDAEYRRLRQHGLWNYGERGVPNRRATTFRRLFPERPRFVPKSDGECGIELADLAAYPIARAILKGNWNEPSPQIVGQKLMAMSVFPSGEDVAFPWQQPA